MKDTVDAQLPDQQAGFHKDHSCTNQIATLRIIVEQSVEWNASWCINSIDYEEAFDSASLSEVLRSHQYVYVPLHKEICMLLVLTNQLQFEFNLSQREIKLCDSESPSHCPSTISKRSRFLNALFCQVVSDTKSHALYLTIHLHSNASRECLGSVGRIEKYINQICPRNMCEKYNEILYGVGFGIDYFKKISPRFRFRGIKNYEYRERSGKFGKLPKSGGDIFVHAKCNVHGMLFDLAKYIIQNMPRGCVDKFEDIYGWTYRDGRDLSGFVDGT
ncbi:unnamed protein product [Schistosoma curassoni]|uniref:Reverse transcriptase domain-containing protein n=1 Tax=Schistosoma curassoni TaxID=6186 RepID=A0A183KMJ9_9TREM|nr:unnamed protein product [Schistosoma curassoni]